MSEPVQSMIQELVRRGVAITSTLAIFEALVSEKFQLDPRNRDVLSEDAYGDSVSYLTAGADVRWSRVWEKVLKKEMEFEREFVKAGGLLLAGLIRRGGEAWWQVLEISVVWNFLSRRAGFSPEESIRIGTLNGATFLGESGRIGTLEPGQQADIVIVRGNPSSNIADIRNVQLILRTVSGPTRRS
jgi:hypothetical protein